MITAIMWIISTTILSNMGWLSKWLIGPGRASTNLSELESILRIGVVHLLQKPILLQGESNRWGMAPPYGDFTAQMCW
ncbi:hypothetical protein A3195_00100 [Candidatus Thiodiazotropha endoloripes]|uniref:Uncharacterized protein n=1 Tax=Candidatus Thiodiazotropha endoloripes TaxID=1818881 RepID=A0A1E2UQL7_9GAMM|nr:hypothetical protein A3195_00100 [Candidatus Thiodiazotropha endoloripes]ODB96784.1 hypothetical protein A3196_08455 [Candidatus Thiodiazotropha endoloripes]